MKARILTDTLPFRLKQPEVAAFQQKGKVTEVTEFVPDPADQLRFSLEASPEPQLAVRFKANTITVRVPKDLAEKWAGTEQVVFDGKVDTGKGRVIEVLVEKDFACLDSPAEDNVGAYPNPNVVC